MSTVTIGATNPDDREQDFAYYTIVPQPTAVATVSVVVTFASIDFNKTAGSPVVALAGSRMIEYTLTYTNSGNAAAQNVSIVESVPANTTFHQATSDAEWSCPDASVAGILCTFTVGTVPPNSTGSVTFVAVVDPFVSDSVTQIMNTASVVADLGVGLGIAGASAATASVTIQRPTSLDLSKQPQEPNFSIRLPFMVQ